MGDCDDDMTIFSYLMSYATILIMTVMMILMKIFIFLGISMKTVMAMEILMQILS